MKVTPESAVPIIPKATRYHLEFLFATKNELLSDESLEVTNEIIIRTKKYPIRKHKRTVGDIFLF
ncbi:hypothetical protein GCM10022246_15200 [Pedobacter ginsengiterrae]|uniref:Uncharacterized protein n=1 Tax=Pedobacter ginsengiterrae TaxID=871696 RepID=A0ABP7PCA3_9SPHI